MKAAKAAKVVRRRPRQARSQSTVDAIYEATLQIIEREGAERITTNRISEVSGFSIGTLYQYFHDRDSLLMAMAIAHRDRLIERLKTTFAASRDQPCREAISRLVAVMVADARSNRKMLRAVVRAVTRKDGRKDDRCDARSGPIHRAEPGRIGGERWFGAVASLPVRTVAVIDVCVVVGGDGGFRSARLPGA